MNIIKWKYVYGLGSVLIFLGLVGVYMLTFLSYIIAIIGSVLVLFSDKNILLKILTIIILWVITPFVFMFLLFTLGGMFDNTPAP